jgi:uncharacterized protein HemX
VNATLNYGSIIVGIIAALAAVAYGYRQTRIAAETRDEANEERRIKAATDPLNAQIAQQRETFREQLQAVRDTAAGQLATANRVIERRDDRIRDLENRVDQLEDELRRGRGHGDNDAARQPHG